jgi:TfoX/Sxy family transcriptional regulator of competence genes
MDFRKPPQALVDTFEAVVPGPPAQQRKMFGYPAAFVNDNMFMGLFQESMMVRLPEDLRAKLLEVEGARMVEPMPGRPMKEYLVLPETLIADRAKLTLWVARSFEYASSLPAKAARAKPAKSRPATKRSR